MPNVAKKRFIFSETFLEQNVELFHPEIHRWFHKKMNTRAERVKEEVTVADIVQ